MAKPLAQIHLREGNAAAASDVLEAYLRAQPGDVPAITLLASAQVTLGRHGKAVAILQDALKVRDTPARQFDHGHMIWKLRARQQTFHKFKLIGNRLANAKR